VNTRTTLPVLIFIILVVLLAVPPVQAMDPIWTYSTTGNRIGGVTVSSDGSAIAAGAEKILLFSRNGTLLAKEPYGEQVLFTPNGMYLISSYGSTLYFFQRNATKSSFQKKWDYDLPGIVRSIDISDDGTTIAASAGAGGTYVVTGAGKLTGGNTNYSAVVRISPYGQTIVGASSVALYRYSSTGTAFLYDNVSMISQPDVMEITGSGDWVVYNDDQRLISVNTAIEEGAERWKTRATGDITSLAMVPAGTKILVGTENGDVDLFDDKGNLVWSHATNPAGYPGAWVKEVALSADGKIAAAGTYDGKTVALSADGKELWSNSTKDHINHIALSGDGSLVIATGEETLYAFSSSAQSLPAVRSPQVTQSPVQQKNTTPVPVTTAPQKTAEIPVSVTREITSVPTTYSVIRTSTQSAVPAIIPLLGILGAAFVFLKRR